MPVMHFPSRTALSPVTATVALPATSIAMLPGVYLFNGQGYDCTAPGLYKFWAGNNTPIQSRFVYGGDLYTFMSALSWHHVHGIADETSDWQALATGGMTSKWELRCGFISGLANWWVPQYGLTSRIVNLLTTGPLNGVDDGHVVTEVSHGGKWKLWDLTNGVYFQKNGVHLSAAEIITEGVLTCERVSLGSPDKFNSAMAGTFDMGSYADMTRLTPAEVDAWYARIYQSVG